LIDTYESAAEAEADRAQMRAQLTAISAWDRALRRDECGAWRIDGMRGSIHTWGDGKMWVLYATCRSALHWTYAESLMVFAELAKQGVYKLSAEERAAWGLSIARGRPTLQCI
jgi:hypothetical protein